MRADWADHPEIWKGMRVVCKLVEDGTIQTGVIESVGIMTYLGEDNTLHLLTAHYPNIRLDDERLIGGLDCFWWPEEEITM